MIIDIFKIMVSLSISGSIIALVLFALKPLTQNKLSKGWQYYIWLVVVARLIIPYVPPIDIIHEVFDFNKRYKAVAEAPLVHVETDVDIKANTNVSLPNSAISAQNNEIIEQQMNKETATIAYTPSTLSIVQQVTHDLQQLLPYLGLVWLAICILLMIRKVLSYLKFNHFIKMNSKIIYDERVLDIYNKTCEALGIKKSPLLYTNNIVLSPMCMGFFRSCIILPDRQAETMSNLHHVFRHELTHFKRFDIYYKWLMQIVLCIHWFNPLVYLVSKQVNTYCELSCDEAVIKNLNTLEPQNSLHKSLVS